MIPAKLSCQPHTILSKIERGKWEGGRESNVHKDAEGDGHLGVQFYRSLPYSLVTGSVTQPGARLVANKSKQFPCVLSPVVLRL